MSSSSSQSEECELAVPAAREVFDDGDDSGSDRRSTVNDNDDETDGPPAGDVSVDVREGTRGLASPSFVGLPEHVPAASPLLTKLQSIERLHDLIDRELVACEAEVKALRWRVFGRELVRESVLICLAAAACLSVAAAVRDERRWVLVFEAAMLAAWLAIALAIRFVHRNLLAKRLVLQARDIVDRSRRQSAAQIEAELDVFRTQADGLGLPKHLSVVYVLRKADAAHSPSGSSADEEQPSRNGSVWVRTPPNLLLDGDVVALLSGQRAPCGLASIDWPERQFRCGELPAGPDGSKPVMYFRCTESPVVGQLRQALAGQRRWPTLMHTLEFELRRIFLLLLLLVGYPVALLVNGVRQVAVPASDAVYSWSDMWLVRPVYAVLPLLFLWSPFLYELLSSLGAARLLLLNQLLQEGRLSSAFSGRVSAFDDDEDERLRHVRRHHRSLPLGPLLRLLARLLGSADPSRLHAKESAAIFGTVTAVCVGDQPGVIASVSPLLAQIYLPAQQAADPSSSSTSPTPALPSVDEPLSTDADRHDASTASTATTASQFLGGAPIQLPMTCDQEHLRAHFNDHSARDFYISALKPLGLNALINSNCQWNRPGSQRCGSPIFELSGGFQSCKCLLGPEIGFHVDAIVANIVPLYELHVFVEGPHNHLRCLVIEDLHTHSLQLLTQGTPSLVTRLCSSFWNGQTICPFTDKDVDDILLAWKTDPNYTAFAHRSLSPAMLDTFDVLGTSQSGTESHPEFSQTLVYISDGVEYRAVHAPVQRAAILGLLNNQHFIGMAAAALTPQPSVGSAIEFLRAAGVRFVWFSDEDQAKSKIFAGKIGLETDWNCSISLQEKTDGQPRSHGASQLRRHIAEVDDVPLLVPLFTDATAETTLETIKILQENGEIVCFIGSAFNLDNTAVYAQANLSIAWQPPPARCWLNTSDQGAAAPLLLEHAADGGAIDGVPTWTPMSVGLSTLPCAALMHHRSHFSQILDLMQEGRAYNEYRRKALQLMVACQLAVHLTEVVGYLAMLPPVLGGYHIMWISWLALLLLVCGLSRGDPETSPMQLFAEKNILHWSGVRLMFKYFAVQFAPVVACTVVVYAWTLESTWRAAAQRRGQPFAFAQIFGFSGGADFTDQPFLDAQAYAQAVAMFAFVLYLAFLSSSLINTKRGCVRSFNLHWLAFVLATVLLTAALVVGIMGVVDAYVMLPDVHFGVWILLFTFPVVPLATQSYVHRTYRHYVKTHQQRLRLEFDTKLGKNSPIQSPIFRVDH